MISIKSDREIELMRQAGKYLVDTFKYIEKYIETGVTTKKLDTLIHEYIISIGCVPSCLGYEGYKLYIN
jgi:methionyl aminopeptidase